MPFYTKFSTKSPLFDSFLESWRCLLFQVSTVTRYLGSRIYNTFTGRTAVTLDKKTNCYFIDRDGELFRYVLQFLRDGNLSISDDFNEWEQLEKEALYWDLKGIGIDYFQGN